MKGLKVDLSRTLSKLALGWQRKARPNGKQRLATTCNEISNFAPKLRLQEIAVNHTQDR